MSVSNRPRMKMWMLLALLTLQPLWAEELVSAHWLDVDGDGVYERVGLRPFERDGVRYGQLVVTDGRGDIVWEGPKDVSEFLFLGEFDKGTLEAAYRYQGSAFLIGSYQKSDVRPTDFRQFMWHDHRFVHLRDGNLLPAPQRPATFVWAKNPRAERWLEEFQGADKEGRLKAGIQDLRARKFEALLLRPDHQEFVLGTGR